MAVNDDDPNDPLSIAQQMQQQFTAANQALAGGFPAVNQIASPRNTAFSTNAPVNTIQQNLDQIPVGGFGLGALQNVGYSRGNPSDIFNSVNTGYQPGQQNTGQIHFLPPGFTAAVGSTGIRNSSPNDIHFLPPGFSSIQGTTGTNGQLQAPGYDQSSQQPQYDLPLLSGERSPQSDPSVGALGNAQRSINIYGQQIVNPAGGGQIISGRGPTVGFLGNNRWRDSSTGQQVINTPSGGTIKAGPSRSGLRKPTRNVGYTGQMYSLGGWY